MDEETNENIKDNIIANFLLMYNSHFSPYFLIIIENQKPSRNILP
jgi:hypothetical protein